MAFKYDWEEFICNTLAKAREMAGDKAKDFEVVIAVKDENTGAPPLVHGAYNYWTGDFFAKLDEVDWENGLPEFADEVEKEAETTAKYNLELLADEMERTGVSNDDEDEVDRLREEMGSLWIFSLLVHKEPEEHNHFFGHGGIGASVTVPFYLYDNCSGEFNEDGMGGYDEAEERFLDRFAKALEEDDGVNESRRPVRRGRFLTEDRIRKSKPIAVIQGNYGYGWDDESSYDMDDVGYLKSIKHDFDEYRKSGHNALYRIVHKRQKLDKPQKFVKGEWLDVEDEPVKTEACGKRKKGKKVIKEDADMNNKEALAFFDDIEEHLRNSYEDGDNIDDIIEMCLDDREDEIRSNLKALATWYDVEVGEDPEDTFDEVREFVRDTLRSEADDWFDLDGEG